MLTPEFKKSIGELLKECKNDWNLFAEEVLGVRLDHEQKQILYSAQYNKLTSVASGTARGKDFVCAVASLCFLYTTPAFEDGKLIENTKVALTAPTDRQILNIMMPEISRLFHNMVKRGFGFLAGRLSAYSIKTDYEEWFLTGFKADEHRHEAWSGFHAVNTMFVVTEASGMAESVFDAIEGNLQGNSRLLIVFNPNISTGYAATAQKSNRFNSFRLDSLTAPNVLEKKMIIPGQVDYEWVKDKVENWCTIIQSEDYNEGEGDFFWEGFYYRPNDLFRIKVRGLFPKVSSDVLVPQIWVDLAKERWEKFQGDKNKQGQLRLGNDVAGMGRDSSCFCHRYGNYVEKFRKIQSGGVANHMEVVGIGHVEIKKEYDVSKGRFPQWFIDSVGEGAGVYSRATELKRDETNKQMHNTLVHSVKGGETAKNGLGVPYNDIATRQYTFKNMRSYMYWCVREWLDPANGKGAMLPPDCDYRGLTELKWNMRSDGSIELEEKKDLIARIGHSPDEEDSLMVTFYPVSDIAPRTTAPKKTEVAKGFF